MNLKFGIVILLVSLGISLSLTEDIKPNATSISPKTRGPRALPLLAVAGAVITTVRTAVTAINDITSLISGGKDMIDLIMNDKSQEIFQENVMKKLDEIKKVCLKIDVIGEKIDKLNVLMGENTDRIVKNIEFSRAKTIVDAFIKNVDYVNRIYADNFIGVWEKMKNYKKESVDNHLLEIVNNNNFGKAMSEMYSDIVTSSPNC